MNMKSVRSYSILAVVLLMMALVFAMYWYVHIPKAGNKRDFLVINVLDKKTYDDCHIAGSEHVNFRMLDSFMKGVGKDTKIIVYCSNYLCSTSDYVAKKLKDAGYARVLVYAAGMAEWIQHGLPVEGPSKAAYLSKKVEVPVTIEQKTDIITTNELAQLMGVTIETKS
jgi:rhodanese-related sulfurtransferase